MATKKKRTIINKETAKDFWLTYYEADYIERIKSLDPLVRVMHNAFELEDIDDKINAVKTLLNGYFDDLIQFMESKDKSEGKTNGRKK